MTSNPDPNPAEIHSTQTNFMRGWANLSGTAKAKKPTNDELCPGQKRLAVMVSERLRTIGSPPLRQQATCAEIPTWKVPLFSSNIHGQGVVPGVKGKTTP